MFDYGFAKMLCCHILDKFVSERYMDCCNWLLYVLVPNCTKFYLIVLKLISLDTYT